MFFFIILAPGVYVLRQYKKLQYFCSIEIVSMATANFNSYELITSKVCKASIPRTVYLTIVYLMLTFYPKVLRS